MSTKTVTITMRPEQAKAWSQWIGEMRIATLPNEICQSLYATCVALKRGESVDVTSVDKELKP